MVTEPTSAELLPLLALNALPKVGPVRIRRLLQNFGNPGNVLSQSASSLQRVNGIGPEIASILTNWQQFASPEKEWERCQKEGITLLTPQSANWPRYLSESSDAPLMLYVWGEVTPADQHAVAIVGSRRCSHYGRSSTRAFAAGLAHAGYTVISGLARGIDTEAHEAALQAGGRTIAVLGSGLLSLYPAENKDLAHRIADGHGAVVSEFSLHCPPDKQTFPQRNRIVAHWAMATLVTESPSRSGSLITAGMATDAGRSVYAVPGTIDQPNHAGCHDLIRNGAVLVTQPDHILADLQELPFARQEKEQRQPSLMEQPLLTEALQKPQPRLNDIESQIFAQLTTSELTMDRITELTQLPVHVVSATLLGLEMKGLVTQIPGQRYVKNLK